MADKGQPLGPGSLSLAAFLPTVQKPQPAQPKPRAKFWSPHGSEARTPGAQPAFRKTEAGAGGSLGAFGEAIHTSQGASSWLGKGKTPGWVGMAPGPRKSSLCEGGTLPEEVWLRASQMPRPEQGTLLLGSKQKRHLTQVPAHNELSVNGSFWREGREESLFSHLGSTQTHSTEPGVGATPCSCTTPPPWWAYARMAVGREGRCSRTHREATRGAWQYQGRAADGGAVCTRPHPSQPGPAWDNPCATLRKQATGAKGPHLPLTPAGPNARESGAAGMSQTVKYTPLLPILCGQHFPRGRHSQC